MQREVESVPYTPIPVLLPLALPSSPGPAVLVVEAIDGAGKRLCANRLPVEVQ